MSMRVKTESDLADRRFAALAASGVLRDIAEAAFFQGKRPREPSRPAFTPPPTPFQNKSSKIADVGGLPRGG